MAGALLLLLGLPAQLTQRLRKAPAGAGRQRDGAA
jgi:hypothetical protein